MAVANRQHPLLAVVHSKQSAKVADRSQRSPTPVYPQQRLSAVAHRPLPSTTVRAPTVSIRCCPLFTANNRAGISKLGNRHFLTAPDNCASGAAVKLESEAELDGGHTIEAQGRSLLRLTLPFSPRAALRVGSSSRKFRLCALENRSRCQTSRPKGFPSRSTVSTLSCGFRPPSSF